MMSTTHVPVLIVGGGIIGLSASLFLSDQGIQSTLVERHQGRSIHPRARGLNRRTMELYRGLGLEESLRAAGAAIAPSFGIYQGTSLAQVIQQHPRKESSGPQPLPFASYFEYLGPVEGIRGTQDMLEPVLLEASRDRGGDLRFHVECVDFEQDDEGVTATLRDRSSEAQSTVRAAYMIAADGANSPIRAKLGVKTTGSGSLGTLLSILFEADLKDLVRGREFSMCLVNQPGIKGLFTSINNHDRWIFHLSYDPQKGEGNGGFSQENLKELLKSALGLPDIDVNIQSALPWEPTFRVAEKFQHGRVFLAGDSAHQMPPWGGQGATTGVADVHNLAWKLAAVLRDQASASLLSTYDAERLPIGRLVADESGAASDESGLISLKKSLGSICNVIRRIPRLAGYGYAYSSQAIDTEDMTPLVWRLTRILPTPSQLLGLCGRAGNHAPHIWVEHAGRRISTLDLFGKDFVIIAGAEGIAWAEATSRASSALGVDVRMYRVGPSHELKAPRGHWESWAGISTTGAILIRPDGFVAWHSWNGPPGLETKLEAVMKRILCR